MIRVVPTPVDYWICTTFQRERMLRAYYINRHKERPLLHTYQELARLFPRGLAEILNYRKRFPVQSKRPGLSGGSNEPRCILHDLQYFGPPIRK